MLYLCLLLNAEMDSLRLEVYARSLFRSFSPVHLLGVQNLTIFTGLRYFDWAHHFREGWDSYWFETPYFDHDQPEYQTIGTLLHYVKPRYLSSVVHLKFDGNRIIEVGQFRQDMRGSLRPLFFRYRNGEGGVRIVPIKLSQRLKWWNTEFGWRHLVGFEIFFLGPREAVRFQGKYTTFGDF